jgi:4,5-DOPA dioxygenase extradiol
MLYINHKGVIMKRMPVLFIGHGSPMNAIEENSYVREWKALHNKLPRPKAILSVSAHWFTDGTRVSDSEAPETIYDMYGFPEELYKVVYPAKGAPYAAHETKNLISRPVTIDNSWGYDHGTWSVLRRIYPEADVPVFQLSVDRNASVNDYYKIGQELKSLRNQGVLIFGSGNVVHNLTRLNWDYKGGYSWAEEFDSYIKENIIKGNIDNVINYHNAGTSATYAFIYLDHYAPLLYVLGAADTYRKVTVFNDSCMLGSLSMTCYLLED